MIGNLVRALADLKEKEALRIADQRPSAGEDHLKILNDGRCAMEIAHKHFEAGDYFTPDLAYSGEILR